MKIKKFDKGMVSSNCYVISSKNEAIVIDPGVSEQYILDYINEEQLMINTIVFTHGHIDHILHVEELKKATNAKVAVHFLDNEILTDSYKNGAYLFGLTNKFNKGDILLQSDDYISFGNKKLVVITTPGHTPGSICLKVDNHVFTGDTLFYLSIGRTDLGMGDQQALEKSITEKLLTLPDETIIYPGHGKQSTIGYEKKHNTFI
ncbi:MAG: MBL fold metallo-hydrolase [Clostridiales bacterium]|nr:MBL fold metallo-hydrolase [Clostridiales bacterium]